MQWAIYSGKRNTYITEQWLCGAGTATARYPMSKVRRGQEELPNVQGMEQRLLFDGAAKR